MNFPKKKLTIAYFNQTLNEPWARLPWIGAVREAKKLGINLLAFHGGAINGLTGFEAQGNIIYDLARSRNIQGLISWKGNITLQLSENETGEFLKSYGVPVVTIEGSHDPYPCVSYGNYEGMKMNVRHLAEVHKNRKIAYLGLIENHTGYNERYRGYKDALKEAGLAYNPDLVRPWVPWTSEVNGKKSSELLDSWIRECIARGVQSFIGACDPIAMWIIDRLNLMGKRVPDDFAVCGFDGFDDYQRFITPLTTVDPGWEKLGQTAVQEIIRQIDGKATDKLTIVPAKPRIAKSCGCMEENVRAARNTSVRFIPKIGIRKSCLKNTVKILQQIPDIIPEDAGRGIIDNFYENVQKRKCDNFIRFFDSLLSKTSVSEKNLNVMQGMITFLQSDIHYMFQSRKKAGVAFSLCNQARIAIANSLGRLKDREITNFENRVQKEQSIGMELITTFELDKLCTILISHLAGMGITSCYLALYENPQSYRYPDPAPEWSEIILACKDGKQLKLEQDEKRIRSRELLPERFICESSAGSFCIYPLVFREEQIGYIVYESELTDADTYYFISSQISSALQGTLLIRKINSHSEELEKGIESLSSSIEEMARNIEAINNNISNQNSAVAQEATAIEEMRNNINRITDLSGTTASLSGDLDI
ncbi:MAG: substrate-binding domain-containing protein, partial [Spirochaetales bacterium]|nr:substrate-binding domain-containing protein [Spirochaetales bacterium]